MGRLAQIEAVHRQDPVPHTQAAAGGQATRDDLPKGRRKEADLKAPLRPFPLSRGQRPPWLQGALQALPLGT